MEKFESAAPPSPGATSRSRGSGPLSTTVRGRPWAAVAETEREVGPLSLQLAARETFDRARGSLAGPGRPGAWLACVCPELHFRLGRRDQQQQQRTSLPSVDLSFVPEEKNSSCNQGERTTLLPVCHREGLLLAWRQGFTYNCVFAPCLKARVRR